MSTNLHLSATEYDRMVERGAFDHLNRKIELIYGEIREMNPAGPAHDDLIAHLTAWSVHATDRERIRVTVQSGLDLSELKSRPEPDLLWVRAARYRDRHPTAGDVKLTIEVSDCSLQADLIEKAALYAEAGIVEYWGHADKPFAGGELRHNKCSIRQCGVFRLLVRLDFSWCCYEFVPNSPGARIDGIGRASGGDSASAAAW